MARARKTDPITSFLAAEAVNADEARVTTTQEFILKALVRPATDVALVERYRNLKNAPRASESGIRSRRNELVLAGLVEDSGLRVKLDSGRHAIVWKTV